MSTVIVPVPLTHLAMSTRITCRSPQDAAPAAASGAPRAEGFDLDLVGSAAAWLTDSTLLLALQSGQLVFVHLHADGGLVKRLRVRLPARCMTDACVV